MYSIILEAWNIQACFLTGTQAYTWWRGRILECSGRFGKFTRCVTCKVYWNAHLPRLRAKQKMMQVKFLMKYLWWMGTNPFFIGCTRNFILTAFVWNALEIDGKEDKFKYSPHSDWWAIRRANISEMYVWS